MTSVFQRLRISLRQAGPVASAVKLWALATDYFFDFRYGLDTCSCSQLDGLTIESENKDKGFRYQPTRLMPLRKLFRMFLPLIPKDSVVVDLGSGKGRILLVASEFRLKEARGVEFARELCEISRRNTASYNARKKLPTQIRVVEADVTRYAIAPEENIFFLCNPFDAPIVGAVLDNLAASLRQHPRKVFIFYYNPTCAQVIEEHRDFVCLQDFKIWGYSFKMYSNRD